MVNNIVKKCAIVLVSFILISLTNTVCFAQKKETTKSIKKQKSKKTKDKTLDSYFYGGKNKKKKGDKKDKKGKREKNRYKKHAKSQCDTWRKNECQ
jgi:hypothetical protein